MKKLLVLKAFIFIFCYKGFSQMPVQIFAGDKSIEYQFLWLKNVDKKEKISLFNFSYFNVDYKNKVNNSYEIYQVASYNLTKNFGIAGGGRFYNNNFNPLLALSFQAVSKNLFISAYPSIQYSLENKELNYSVFGLFIYTPPINKVWSMYNQLFFEPLFNPKQHLFSYQQVRIGLDYKNQFQFGIGANLTQLGNKFQYAGNYGLFIRKDLQ